MDPDSLSLHLYQQETKGLVHSTRFDTMRHYHKTVLLENQVNLDDVLAKTSKKDIIDIAKWAYQNCDYMNNILLDYSGEIEASIAHEETKKLTDEGSDDYDEIYQDILDELVCKVSSVEIIINGKTYKGK